MTPSGHKLRRVKRVSIIASLCGLAYLLSSGPVLAVACLLRERTGWDGFYAVSWFYYPLLAWRPWSAPFESYMALCCWAIGATTPG